MTTIAARSPEVVSASTDRAVRELHPDPTPPIVVALGGAPPFVWAELSSMLEAYGERVTLVSARATCNGATADLALIVPIESAGLDEQINRLTDSHPGARLVVLTPRADPVEMRTATDAGVRGYLVAPDAGSLVAALLAIHAGQIVSSDARFSVGASDGCAVPLGAHPPVALSDREAEILRMIARGLNNQEIAKTAYISINTVKSYIRTAYAKIGVDSRTKALLWAIDHGMRPGPFAVCVRPECDDEAM